MEYINEMSLNRNTGEARFCTDEVMEASSAM